MHNIADSISQNLPASPMCTVQLQPGYQTALSIPNTLQKRIAPEQLNIKVPFRDLLKL